MIQGTALNSIGRGFRLPIHGTDGAAYHRTQIVTPPHNTITLRPEYGTSYGASLAGNTEPPRPC